jgi:hypothetical protein
MSALLAVKGIRMKSFRFAVLGATCLLLIGCTSVSLVERFEPAPKGNVRTGADALLVVVEPDARPLQGKSHIGSGFLALIPLVPYGHQQYSPEFSLLSAAMTESDFPSEVARTVIKDLRAAGVAGWVGRPEDRLPGQSAPQAAVTLHLTLTEGVFHRNLTAYGVSFVGALLWMVGLPTSYGSAEIGLVAELRDAAGTSLGRQEFRGKESATEWLYRPMGPAYTRALPGAYAQISPGLREFVSAALAR